MNSTVISITNEDGTSVNKKKSNTQFSLLSFLPKRGTAETKRLIHSIKVGIALVLVSLLYLLDPLYKHFGDNAMWAIMTVVVVFEYYAGATLGKGLNRGIGTILGGGLGCLAASLAQGVEGVGNPIIVGISVFIFGAAATYSRLIPSIKQRYDYGAMIFILTFNLIVVSGLRAEKVTELARDRLSTIGIGFGICVFTSLLIFPVSAGDELHCSTASKFENLANSIEGCLEEYFKTSNDKKETRVVATSNGYKAVLHSKAKDESLANLARWEPWHGKFGLFRPWDKYLKIGELLRELAATILSLNGCLQSPRQLSVPMRQTVKEPCEAVASLLVCTLRELEQSIMSMRKCRPSMQMVSKLQSRKLELSVIFSPSKLGKLENSDGLAMASFMFLLMDMVDKVEILAKEVEKLGDIAGFHCT